MQSKLTLTAILCISVFTSNLFAQKTAIDYVNPFIGTGGHGHTYPGATVPFGFVQLSPDTRLEGWDGCGGYHYDDEYIYGFSHTHLNGTGVPDLCDILFMPTVGECRWNNGADGQPGYRSHFSHSNEKASPGYYQVLLDDYNINAEMTSTVHAGMHRYSFPAGENSNIILDLTHRDEVLESSIQIISDTEIAGLRRSRYWAENQYVYFVACFSKPFESYDISIDDVLREDIRSIDNKKSIKACFNFVTRVNEPILVKVGISAVSIEGARKNLNQEIPGWNFDDIKEKARNSWTTALSKIEVEGGSDEQKTIFYTALYHTMVQPNTFNDVDGSYRGMDNQIHKTDGFTMYTVFSLWDTYRAWHPLMTIIDQARTLDYIKTFLAMYEQWGLLPVWELQGNETNCMIGYHSVPVIVDAYLKGIQGFDAVKALDAMKKSATKEQAGLRMYSQTGFIQSDRESESVSKTLEYAYDDWCIAMMAKALGKEDDYREYLVRAQSFKNLFDPQTGFMRPRINGGWYEPFDPFEVNFNYTEANSWQYNFSATQDMNGLIGLHGGKEKLARKLDDLFNASTKTTGREQSDISGLIGQYAHGNEPSHHIAYLYPFAGQPWRTQELVHTIMKEFYTNTPGGSIGNEDCGQMSAWAVMSAMGFYPVNPGSDFYVIGTPWFDKVTIRLENGKSFIVTASNRNNQNYYIRSAKLNGKNHPASFILHKDIMKGGELHFEMTGQPEKNWGTGKKNEPETAISDHLIVPAPYVGNAARTFTDNKEVTLNSVPDANIYYVSGKGKMRYSSPFSLTETGKVRFYSELNGKASQWISSEFIKVKNDMEIKLTCPPANQYSGNGPMTLVDGLEAADDFRIGGWLGFEKVNLEAVIDLKTAKKVSRLSADFLQDENSWIFMPSQVEFQISDDGISYRSAGIVKTDVPFDRKGAVKKAMSITIPPVEARFVKVIATSLGTCPDGHKGYPNACWVFCDEITIE